MSKINELEIYAPIDGFPNYLVTSKGRVLSLKDRHCNNRILELKQRKNKRNGYMQVDLHKDGKKRTMRVHRLVAKAFIPNPENKPEVNHIDEDKTNNHVFNLEWMTGKENVNHGTCIERMRKTNSDGRMKGNNNPMYGKKHTEQSKQKMKLKRRNYIGDKSPRAKAIIGFKINGCDIKFYKYMKESEKDGFSPDCIRLCCKGKQKNHKDYEWYYADEYLKNGDGNNE